MPVITGAVQYPEKIEEKLKALGVDVTAVDALTLAEEAGSSKATNVVLMGVASTVMEFSEEMWQNAINDCVPPKYIEMNRKAFALGQKAAR